MLTLIDANSINLTALAKVCDISESDVRKKMTYFISRGVVLESSQLSYRTVDHPDAAEDCGIVYQILSSSEKFRAVDKESHDGNSAVDYEEVCVEMQYDVFR